jgi:hypothetical protein
VGQWLLDTQGDHVFDRRVGSFYDESGRSYRVNGRMAADHIEFYIDPKHPDARYDQLVGRRFTYTADQMLNKLGRVEVSATAIKAGSDQ